MKIEVHVTDPVQHFGPSLHGDALEHSKHCKANVVKVGDAIVGPLPAWPTLGAIDHTAPAVTRLGTRRRKLIFCYGVDIWRPTTGG